jgi:hypothetical protein
MRESLADHSSRSVCLLDSADDYERILIMVPSANALRLLRIEELTERNRGSSFDVNS